HETVGLHRLVIEQGAGANSSEFFFGLSDFRSGPVWAVSVKRPWNVAGTRCPRSGHVPHGCGSSRRGPSDHEAGGIRRDGGTGGFSQGPAGPSDTTLIMMSRLKRRTLDWRAAATCEFGRGRSPLLQRAVSGGLPVGAGSCRRSSLLQAIFTQP